MIILYTLALLLTFYLLAKIVDGYFIDALDKISQKLKLSSDAAGATFMAIGSSAPELFVAFIAVFKPGDHEMIGAGTIVGSAIFNILVIIGASAAVKTAVVTWQPVVRDAVFYSLSIVLLLITFLDGHVTLQEAFIFIALYVIYVVAVINWRKILPYKDNGKIEEPKVASPATRRGGGKKVSIIKRILKPFDFVLSKLYPSPKHYYWVFTISILLIGALSWVLVESAVQIAHILNIPAAIVALTILAAGTSIPDMISSIVVAKQGRGDMAISNAIGSNIFDILIGLGLPWMVIIIISGDTVLVVRENLLSSVFLLFATVIAIFFLLFLRNWKIGRRSGYILIFMYVLYLVWAISSI